MTIELATKTAKRKSLGFYTTAEASRIAQVSSMTVNSWKRNGIIIPSVRWIDETNKEHLGHTFEVVVYLRLIRMLRQKGVTLYNSVIVVKRLKDRFGYPGKKWANASIFTDGQEVFVYDKNDPFKTTDVTKKHQRVAEEILGDDFIKLRDRADALLVPTMFMENVEIDPSIQNGLPIIRGTKILTNTIHNLIIQNYSSTDIHDMYPFIPISKILGAEEYEIFLDRASLN